MLSHMLRKSIVIALVVIVMFGGLAYWAWQRQAIMPNDERPQVVASFYPLAEFARQVGGDLVAVTTVVPADSEPHEYEPTPPQITKAYNAAVFIYNGSGVDPWAERIASELTQKGVLVINMSDTVALLSAPPADEHDAEESPFDPHFWLDPVLVTEQVKIIRDVLTSVDPTNAPTYHRHSEAYQSKLHQLDQDYQTGLAACVRRDIVTSHAAFGYLAKRYNLSIINIAGISTEEEPSARRLSEIATLAKEKNIQYIFFETLVSPRLAQTIASEIGAQTLVFNPLEGLAYEQQQAGQDYVSVMEDNLRQLQTALECH
jgi:zinc transport system substrate-binding protein